MALRLSGIWVVSLLIAAAFAAPAAAQQVSPGGPNAQVSEYIEPGGGGGAGQVPGLGGGAAEPGAAGDIPFTGLTILPLVMIGVALIAVVVLLRRRQASLRVS
ncbi:MAG: hypothetical protein ACRDKX_01805 [Solirubrobacterales bacterium]